MQPAPVLAIRRGDARDIEAVHRLLVDTWHHTYDALMGRAAVSRMTQAWHRPEILAQQLGRTRAAFLVAELDDRIVGHAYARLSRANILFLARLYVHPDCQRQSIGTELLTHLLPLFAAASMIELSVVKQNRQAVEFYRRYEFTVTGESVEDGAALLLMQRRVQNPLG